MIENIFALVFVVAFMGLSFWVVDRVLAYSHDVTCLQYKMGRCR